MRSLVKLLLPFLLISTLAACGDPNDGKGGGGNEQELGKEGKGCKADGTCDPGLDCSTTDKVCRRPTGPAAPTPCKSDNTCTDTTLTCVDTGVPAHGKICAKECTAAGGECASISGTTCSTSTFKKVSDNSQVNICMPSAHSAKPVGSTGGQCKSDNTCTSTDDMCVNAGPGGDICAKKCTGAAGECTAPLNCSSNEYPSVKDSNVKSKICMP